MAICMNCVESPLGVCNVHETHKQELARYQDRAERAERERDEALQVRDAEFELRKQAVDDRGSLQARIAVLERELADARRDFADLKAGYDHLRAEHESWLAAEDCPECAKKAEENAALVNLMAAKDEEIERVRAAYEGLIAEAISELRDGPYDDRPLLVLTGQARIARERSDARVEVLEEALAVLVWLWDNGDEVSEPDWVRAQKDLADAAHAQEEDK